VGGVIVLLLILVAFGARFGIIPLDDPRAINSGLVYAPPSLEFPLGTDHATRDVMSRLFHGAWISLYVGLGSVLIGITAGFILGVAIAYAGGVIDLLFQRLIDALMALPGLIIALAIVAVLGSSLNNVIIAVVIGMIAPVVRTVRSQVLGLKELDYVLAARAVGASPLRIVFRHLAPNCFATYLILATYYLGFAIIIEASLSFLGVGTPPDIPSWGGMLTRAAQENIKLGFWVAMFPGLAIFVVVLGFNLLGDALRDVFDPKLRGR
jgi:peptide/nickel transport system permease protein